MSFLRVVCATVLGILAGMQMVSAAYAETRVALVIGNGAYASPIMPRLANPPHDAVAIGNTLKKLGFDVDVVTDATKQTMEDALARLARKARDADMTVIFYAGHGLQDQGKNYFAPVDATLSDETDLRRRFVRLDDVLDDLAGAKGARILLLDACRDNGAVEALRAVVPKFRSAGVSRGLARIAEAQGQLVAFATQPDRVAADGAGADSPFTTALVAHLGEPGIELRTVLTRVRIDVAKATNNDQIPEVSDSLLGEIYLQPPSATGGPPAAPTPPVASAPAISSGPADKAAWQRIATSVDPVDFESFARVFPDSSHRAEADAKAKSLRAATDAKVAALEPAPAPKPVPTNPPVCDGGLVASVGDAGVEDAAVRCLKPKDVFRDCGNCPEMVVIPAGSFTMGSPSSEKDRFNNEGPQHQVRIGAPFAVGKFSVTFDEWDTCVSDGGCGSYSPKDNFWGRGHNPVISVSWDDAKTYVSWLSRKTGKAYRLLTEAEREYVTRAGTAAPYWWGRSISKDQANYYSDKTVPVDSFHANPFGLYNVHGNVWEWVEDCWHGSYNAAPTDGSAWTSGDCHYRVLRGGGWGDGARDLRAANRTGEHPDSRDLVDGFRVARTLTP